MGCEPKQYGIKEHERSQVGNDILEHHNNTSHGFKDS